MFHIILPLYNGRQHFRLCRRDVKIPSVRLQAADALQLQLPNAATVHQRRRLSFQGEPSLRSQSSFCQLQVLNYTSPVEVRAALRPKPRPSNSPRGLLLSDKDQELFQLPPLLLSTKHNFKHCTSQPSTYAHTLCTRTGFSL